MAPPETPSAVAAVPAYDSSAEAASEEAATGEASAAEPAPRVAAEARVSHSAYKAPPPNLGAKTDTSPTPTSAEPSSSTASPASGRTPLLIYTATVTMAVFGLDEALDAVERLARAQQGYLVRRSDTSITVRVPAAAFQETLTGVGRVGDELHRDVNARDVTEEYADLEIRLRNAEVVRQRLEGLLAKAGSVEEALSVERELARVTGTIEALKGKLKLMSELVAFSTITVNFQARAVEHVGPEHPLPFDWLKQLGLSNLLAL